jgi:hypothetical protein
MVNPRTKGADGERQVYKMLNDIIVKVMSAMAFPAEDIEKARTMVQRNQNQSAVGGCDLTNTFGIAIEVKRQEVLSIPAWWRQVCTAAERNNELPLLIFRQNNKPWRVRTYGFLHAPARDGSWSSVQAVVEIDEPTFKQWFEAWVRGKLESGYDFRT